MNPAISRRALLGAAGLSVVSARTRGRVTLVDTKGEKIAFTADGRPLFEYRYSAARPKTYIHPLYGPNGAPVTIDSPPDHVHHRGVMLAWSDIKGVDFWGEDNPGPPHGQIVHQRFESASEKSAAVTAVNHWIARGEVLLIERQTVRAPAQAADVVRLEWESELRPAAGPITLSAAKHPYDGLGIRFVRSMDGGRVLNSNGTATIEQANGEPAKWATYSGALENGDTCGVAVFDDPRNPRHPTPFFVMNKPFGYLSAAPTFRDPLPLDAGQSVRFRWAIVTYLGAPERARLDRLYQNWLEERHS
jgi:hypothetical protein